MLNTTNLSWSIDSNIESFGMPRFVEWSVETEVAATTIWSPNIASILEDMIDDIGRSSSISLLLTGGGVGEVSAYDRSSSSAPVLEITAAQGTLLIITS